MAIIAEGKFYRVLRSDTGAWEIRGIKGIRDGISQAFSAKQAADWGLPDFHEERHDDLYVDERCREILSAFHEL
jgi:hypothetical protein